MLNEKAAFINKNEVECLKTSLTSTCSSWNSQDLMEILEFSWVKQLERFLRDLIDLE